MLADQDHPLEDAMADPAPPDPKVVVVYRTRGVPWLLIPPLLLVAGVAAIVVYRRSEPEPWHVALASRPADSPPEGPSGGGRATAPRPPEPVRPVRVDAVAELSEATGRPAARTAPNADGPRYDPTPSPAPPPPAPAPAASKPDPAPAPAPAPPAGGPPATSTPMPVPAAEPPTAPAPAAPTTSGPLASTGPEAVPSAPGPRDPSATPPADAAPAASVVGPPPPRVGFDADAARAGLEPGPGPPAEQPPGPTDAGLSLDPPRPDARPQGRGAAAEAIRARQTREAMLDEQAESERRLASKLHLEAIMADLDNVAPDEYRRVREEFKTRVRRQAAEDRPIFHAELKRLINQYGRGAGPDIQALRERFGVDTLPEIFAPANRDLRGPAAKLTTPARIERMRRWGLPETMVLDDLYEQQQRNVRSHGGPRNDDEAWVYAAWHLLHYPPPSPRPQPGTDGAAAVTAPR